MDSLVRIKETTDKEFENDISSEIDKRMILVDFFADWCGPCKMLAPILEEIADEYQSIIKIVKIDIDKNTEVPSRFNILSIPTLILFKDRKAISTKVGLLTKSKIIDWIESN